MALAEPAAVLSDAKDLKAVKRAQMHTLVSLPATPLPDAVTPRALAVS